MQCKQVLTAAAVSAVTCAAHAGSVTVLDQLGPANAAWVGGSSSSSQFPAGEIQSVFATVDNFTVTNPVRVTTIEGAITGLNETFQSFDLVDAWTVQIYSSLDAATSNAIGDVYSATFDFPTNLTKGFAVVFGREVEVATFSVDVDLSPGDYYVTIAMGNADNGTIGIQHSTVGDGPCSFAIPSSGQSVALGAPASYRIVGESVLACADVNGDDVVNILDLVAVILSWGTCGGCNADVIADGQVDVLDLQQVILGWGACNE